MLYHRWMLGSADAAPSRKQDTGLRRNLLRWYRLNRRELPWRAAEHCRDPYRVWVSEVMLQQTQVAVVIPYYRNFLARFPTIQALAAAPEQEVLAAWSGLGYYRRARLLHRGAREVCERHGGRFPLDPAAVRALPGIGAYTCGAILSIAAGAPLAAVDGNAARIASRLCGRHLTPKAAQPLVAAWLAPRRAGEFNQALMDLGATVCLPRAPQCGLCPLRRQCASRLRAVLPAPPPPAPRMRLELHYALTRRHRRVLLRQRPADAGQLAGMWELPPAPPPLRTQAPLASLRHAITTRAIVAHVYSAPEYAAAENSSERAWISEPRAAGLALTGLSRTILRQLLGWRL